MLRAEMHGDGTSSFASVFARAAVVERDRLLSSLHHAVEQRGAFDEVLRVGERSFRVKGRRSDADPALVEATCEEIAPEV
jgi:hypothetical protein